MKKYQSHKVVEAAPIDHIERRGDGAFAFVDVGGTLRDVTLPADFFGRGIPQRGDYLVRYAPDGYLSWSPKAAFEDGYAEIAPEPETWQARVQKEATDLNEKIVKLRKYLLSGPALDEQALSLLQYQYATMAAYYDVLEARLRHEGVISPETPPTVRDHA